MMQYLPVAAATCLMPVLLYFEKRESRKGMLPVKTFMSLLFVLTVALRPVMMPGYYRFLFIGLILCLVGDVCLVFQHRKMFLAGLVAFLLGHVFYIFGFGVVSFNFLNLLFS